MTKPLQKLVVDALWREITARLDVVPRCDCDGCDHQSSCSGDAVVFVRCHWVDECEDSDDGCWSGFRCGACWNNYLSGVKDFLSRVGRVRVHCLSCGGPLRLLSDVVREIRPL